MIGTTRIAEKSLGTREILNTNHGITAYVERSAFYGAPGVAWTVAVVCNGIADYSKTYTTRREALADFESM